MLFCHFSPLGEGRDTSIEKKNLKSIIYKVSNFVWRLDEIDWKVPNMKYLQQRNQRQQWRPTSA